jgi:hypothetical protein
MNSNETFSEAIKLWCAGARVQEAIAERDFLELDSLHRMIVLRNGYLTNLIALCRANPRLDSRSAILGLITFFSDNGKFRCTLKMSTMAQILKRDYRNVKESVKWLEQEGAISINRTADGQPNSYWPRLTTAVLDKTASIAWLATGLSELPGKAGRPRKAHNEESDSVAENTGDVDILGFSQPTGDIEEQYRGCVYPHVAEKYQGCRRTNTGDVEAHSKFTKENSLKEPIAQQAAHDCAEAVLGSKEGSETSTGACTPALAGQRTQSPQFGTFWEAFPNKRGKAKAKTLWAKLSPEQRTAAFEALGWYNGTENVKRGFVQQGDTYLSKRTWEDRPARQQHDAAKDLEKACEQETLAIALDLAEGAPKRILKMPGVSSFAGLAKEKLLAACEFARREFEWTGDVSAFAGQA